MPRPKVLTLLLAGGEGSRLKVLTETQAKPALPFAGVYRLIDFPLSNCVHSGIGDVWVIEQFQPHALNDHLLNGRPWDLDRNTGGLRILPPYTGAPDHEDGWAEGNADALYRNRRFIREFAPDVLLVLSADHVYTLDYRDVLDAHLHRGAAVTMVTAQVSVERASRFGVVQVNGDGRVTAFDYKPERPRGGTVTTEVFVYDAATLLDTLDALGGDGGSGDSTPLTDFGHELLPTLVRERRAYAFPLAGYWRDVGTVESYWEGHMDLLRPEPPLVLDDPGWPVLSTATARLPAHVHGSARIANSLVSPGCAVHGTVVDSVLAPGVVVEEGATVHRAVVLHGAAIRAGAEVAHAIVDRGVDVGRGARVGDPGPADAPLAAVLDEGIEHPEIAVVGCHARIEPGTRVAAGECVAGSADPKPTPSPAGRVER